MHLFEETQTEKIICHTRGLAAAVLADLLGQKFVSLDVTTAYALIVEQKLKLQKETFKSRILTSPIFYGVLLKQWQRSDSKFVSL